MWRWSKAVVLMLFRTHLLVSLAIVGLVAVTISLQITHRASFANSELRKDVIDRWGAPLYQAAPSVRYVASGSVFSSLAPLALDKQDVTVDAAMNYRKRGLIYFSGFDVHFVGKYEVENREDRPIDLVFVFPIQAQKNQVLLSDLAFTVNGEKAPVNLSSQSDRLVWTGRASPGERLRFEITFRGRGLESFVYALDPSLRVNGFRLAFTVTGGANHDYPPGVAPANSVTAQGDGTALVWEYGSLESGVPVGLILPTEKAFDAIVGRMIARSWAPFIPLILVMACLGIFFHKPLRAWQAYLFAAWYGLFFVLVAYLAAFMSFYLAYGLALAVHAALVFLYLRALLNGAAARLALAAVAAFLVLPTLAVILEGYTGLLYTLELAAGLAGLMIFTTRATFRQLVDELLAALFPARTSHAPDAL